MVSYKHIETTVGEYVAAHYSRPVEVGIGRNTGAAVIVREAGIDIRCTDVKVVFVPEGIPFKVDDIFTPDLSWYEGADLIYAIRPGIEMIPPLIELAEKINCDLIVYHLGFESYGNGAEKIECGVTLHRYVRAPGNSE